VKIYYDSSLWSRGKGLPGLPLHNCFTIPSFQKGDSWHFVLEGINTIKCAEKEYNFQ
jgi:hypothetical protein